ncbi:response regulator, partial [Escherichia coli]|nr:response regulator [Escherichia coli]
MNENRILVVDDEPQIQRFLHPALTASGYDVISAATGADAERLIATSAPDLVILDLGLPDKDGKEVIKTVRA